MLSSLCIIPFRTLFEQRGSISVNGVGSVIGGMFEAFGQRFLQHGAKKVNFFRGKQLKCCIFKALQCANLNALKG